jgi:aldehyde dehydrogenase (NAD+)
VARSGYLHKAAEIMERRLDDIAETMTREMGKTLPEAKGETLRGIQLLRYYAGEGWRKTGDHIPSADRKSLLYTTRVPLGVVGIIPPWNFPVAIPLWKMAPALIYGNTVVLKPASEAAVSAVKIVEVLHEAGFPPGVVNMVTGSGSVVGQRIIDHPDVSGISFTGSNATGRQVAVSAAKRGAKVQTEMGGKNPAIVDDEADLDLAVELTVNGAMKSTGQKCTATSRVFVVDSVYDDFKRRLLDKVRSITVGNPLHPETWMGPLASEKQLETVMTYIDIAVREGARLIFGGRRLRGGIYDHGYFVEPTVFEDVTNGMTIAQEEIFGPVIALIRVKNLEEAIAQANDVRFGLSASLFTRNMRKAMEFIDRIDAGMVRINGETAGVELQAPFGGMKESSSHSREQGTAAIEFYTEIKTITITP